MNVLMERWRALADRERWLVAAAMTLTLLTFGQLIWRGGQGALEGLRADVASQHAAIQLAQTLAAAGPAPSQRTEPLLALAERSARDSGVGAALKRLDGTDDGRVRARLEGASFAATMRWLAQIQAGAGVSVESIALERGSASGLIDASIVLAPAGSR